MAVIKKTASLQPRTMHILLAMVVLLGSFIFSLSTISALYTNSFSNYSCYQESANSTNLVGTDGICQQNYTGEYNTTERFSIAGYGSSHFISHYKLPYDFKAENNVWKIGIGDTPTIYNYTIPSHCINQSNNSLSVRLTQQASVGWVGYYNTFKTYGSCYNLSGIWHNFTSIYSGSQVNAYSEVQESRLYDGEWLTGVAYINGYWWTYHTTGLPEIYDEAIYWFVNGTTADTFNINKNYNTSRIIHANSATKLIAANITITNYNLTNYTLRIGNNYIYRKNATLGRTEGHGESFDDSASIPHLQGIFITPRLNITLSNVTVEASVTANTAWLFDANYNILASAAISSNVAHFNYNLVEGRNYTIQVNSTITGSADYTRRSATSVTGFPFVKQNIVILGAKNSNNAIETNLIYNIESVGSNGTNVDTVSFRSAANSYLSSCGTSCTLPLIFSTSDTATLGYSDLFASNLGFYENSQTYSSTAIINQRKTFEINISYDSAYYSGIIAYLVYNNTNYTSTQYGSNGEERFSTSFVVPNSQAQTNYTFYWLIGLSNSTTTTYYTSLSYNQTVSPILFDNCTAYTVNILNATLKDEETKSVLNGNTTIDIYLRLFSVSDSTTSASFNRSYNATNPARVCINDGILNSTNLSLFSTIRYTSDSRVAEYNNLQNYTLTLANIPLLLDLYDLLTADSQEFLVTLKDDNYLFYPGALITVQRLYVADGTYRTVESVVTDANGNAIVHLDTDGVLYKIIVSKDGNNLFVSSDFQPFCDNAATGDCRVSIQLTGSIVSVTDFSTRKGLTYNFSYTTATRTVSVPFIVTDGLSSTVLLNVTKYDVSGAHLVCTNSLTAVSGTLSCIVPQSYANSTIIAYLYKDGQEVAYHTFTIGKISPSDLWGSTRVVLIIFLFSTLIFISLGSKSITVIMGILGFIIAGLLNLVYLGTNGSYIGAGSAILWFMIAGGIIIWKASNQR